MEDSDNEHFDEDALLARRFLDSELSGDQEQEVRNRLASDPSFREVFAEEMILDELVATLIEGPPPSESECRPARDLFEPYRAGRTRPDQTALLSRHFEECVGCEAEYELFVEKHAGAAGAGRRPTPRLLASAALFAACLSSGILGTAAVSDAKLFGPITVPARSDHADWEISPATQAFVRTKARELDAIYGAHSLFAGVGFESLLTEWTARKTPHERRGKIAALIKETVELPEAGRAPLEDIVWAVAPEVTPGRNDRGRFVYEILYLRGFLDPQRAADAATAHIEAHEVEDGLALMSILYQRGSKALCRDALMVGLGMAADLRRDDRNFFYWHVQNYKGDPVLLARLRAEAASANDEVAVDAVKQLVRSHRALDVIPDYVYALLSSDNESVRGQALDTLLEGARPADIPAAISALGVFSSAGRADLAAWVERNLGGRNLTTP